MAISCLGLFRPCFPVKYSRSTTLRSTLLWYFDFVLRWFVQSLETLPWEITKIFDWQANIPNQPERSVRWRADRLKKAPRPCRRFFKLLPPQSPRGFSALARLYYLARHPSRVVREIKEIIVTTSFIKTIRDLFFKGYNDLWHSFMYPYVTHKVHYIPFFFFQKVFLSSVNTHTVIRQFFWIFIYKAI